MEYKIIEIKEDNEFIDRAVKWLHPKFGVREKVLRDSFLDSLDKMKPYPRWFFAMVDETIVGVTGVIENDYCDMVTVKPFACSVYVDKAYRNNGIAGGLLNHVAKEMHDSGIDALYLITDHIGFYEKYGYIFHSMVRCNNEENDSRMYVHFYQEEK